MFIGRERPAASALEKQIMGTGFIVSVPAESSQFAHVYVVTAAHVIEGDGVPFIRVPTTVGSVTDCTVSDWTCHPKHDVAVAPILLPANHNTVRTALGQFIDAEAWRKPDDWIKRPFDLELGDVVYFIGLLGKIAAMTEQNIPMVRSGTLGALWQERLPVRRTPKDDATFVTAHLIDCRSFAGFSGSPCYVQQSQAGLVPNEGGQPGVCITTKYRTALLGLVGGHFDDWVGTRKRVSGPARNVSSDVDAPVSTGVGYVIPAEFIRETLYLEELREMREEVERSAGAQSEYPATMETMTEFESFADRESGGTRRTAK